MNWNSVYELMDNQIKDNPEWQPGICIKLLRIQTHNIILCGMQGIWF